MAIGGAYVISR